jgi:hypothetical protein
MRTLLTILILILCAISPVSAQITISCPDSIPEGEPFRVRISAVEPVISIKVQWLGREIIPELARWGDMATADLLLGLTMHERNAKNSYLLGVEAIIGKDYQGPHPGFCATGIEHYPMTLSTIKEIIRFPKKYPEQHLEVARKFSELSPENRARSERESVLVREAKGTVSPRRLWQEPMLRPVPGKITSDFGFRRFFNDEPKTPHSGADLRAARGETIRCCAGGRVILTGEHFYAGGSVYVDHGQGVVSMYFHLSEILVETGSQIGRGDILGKAGETGRVTGPHLHWGLSIFGQLVDPMLMLTGS